MAQKTAVMAAENFYLNKSKQVVLLRIRGIFSKTPTDPKLNRNRLCVYILIDNLMDEDMFEKWLYKTVCNY